MIQTRRSIAPYGSWRSPITPRLLAETGVALGGLQAVAGRFFWLELRPLEDGRYVLARREEDGTAPDITPPDHNARTLVHEYGGGSYALHDAGDRLIVLFSEFADQRLYRQDLLPDGQVSAAVPVTPAPSAPRALRYADGRVTPDGRSLLCVRERHEGDEVFNELVAVDFTAGAGAEPRILAQGHDFYAAPRISPDGSRLAWLCWDHPRMPWDGTELWVADLTPEGLARPRLVAGGADESVVQPSWDALGRLVFISDRSGWWNLYRHGDGASGDGGASAVALAPLDAEFAKPPWVFGLQSYAYLEDGCIICFYSRDGVDHLALIDPDSPGLETLPCAFTTFSHIAVTGDTVAIIGGNARQAATLALVDASTGELRPVRHSKPVIVDAEYISTPQPMAFPTMYEPGSVSGPLAEELAEGTGDLTAHALYYPPANARFAGPDDQRPPLVVMSHGGPTSAREAILSLEIQFWTSRGVAVVDVNYGGSTGYGRAYRERLRGNWGIVDTVDCINAARHLVERGEVDPERIAIQGGSAGGYTTLNALTRHRFFAAGASYFGLADLEVFVNGGTHKFESQYLTGLVGPYPERADVYRERSPITHVRDLSCPVIVLQGLEDAIVPPAQAEIIVASLKANGLPFAYLPFEGEQHGFRKAANIVKAAEAVLSFYGRVFGFTPADENGSPEATDTG
jgi:dipeptidyl aminopeptidase/acylaminoacyl peptidase